MGSNGNVCRSVTFYNNYIPSNPHNGKWDYLAFGTVDGIDVGRKNLFEGNDKSVMELIWEQQKVFSRNIGIQFIAQQTYIIYSGDIAKEQEFWEEMDYPFYFFCRIQCCGDKTTALIEKSRIEEKLTIRGQSKACVYLTYDNSDLFVILRTERYDVGAGIINYLHSKVNLLDDKKNFCGIKSSFTIFAVSQRWLKEADLRELNTQRIDKLYLKVIERMDGAFEKICDEIAVCLEKSRQEMEAGAVLGADDGLIFLDGVGIGDFLSMYIPDDGKLFYKNTSEMVANVTTGIVLTEQHLENAIKGLKLTFEKLNTVPEEDEWEIAYERMVKSMEKQLIAMDEKCEYKELYTILNVVPKFEGKLFNDYLMFPLLKPIDLLIRILSQQKICKTDKEYFYDFIKSFSMYVQSAVITDRHATQMMDFNKKIYDIPVKINAFYNAYLDFVKNILTNSADKDYVFFVMPGMNSIVNVMELYPDAYVGESEKKRLIKVEIPEASAYEMTNMMMILAHESAHYVGGTTYRKRAERFEVFLRSCAHIYVSYVRSMNCQYGVIEGVIPSVTWKEIEKRVYYFLDDKLDKRNKREYWDRILIPDAPDELREACWEEYKEYGQYTAVMSAAIEQTFQNIEWQELMGMFYPIIYQMQQEKQQKTIEGIRQATERFVACHNRGTTRTTISTVLQILTQLYEETFADMISILTLDISAEEYVRNILKNLSEQDMYQADLLRSDGILRIAAILAIMIGLEKQFPKLSVAWTNELGNVGKINQPWAKTADQALKIWEDCLENKRDSEPTEKYEKNVFNTLYDGVVLSELVGYLQECADEFAKVYSANRASIEKLQKIYHCFADASFEMAEEQVRIIVDFIEDYRVSISKEWMSIAEHEIM